MIILNREDLSSTQTDLVAEVMTVFYWGSCRMIIDPHEGHDIEVRVEDHLDFILSITGRHGFQVENRQGLSADGKTANDAILNFLYLLKKNLHPKTDLEEILECEELIERVK